MTDTKSYFDQPLMLLSEAVSAELDESLKIYRQVVGALVSYLANDEDADALRLVQNSALTLAIGLSDLGRTLDDLDGEGVAWIGTNDPRMIRPLVRAMADSMTLLLAARSQDDCYRLNLLDEDEIEQWFESEGLSDWLQQFPFSKN